MDTALLGGFLLIATTRGAPPKDEGRAVVARRRRSRAADVALAVRRGDADAVERLVREQGADPDGALGGVTPLAAAVDRGALHCVSALLRLGADPNLRSVDAAGRVEPPLVAAVRLGGPPLLCDALMDAGADPDAADFYGHSPLWASVFYRRPRHLEVLLRRGARVRDWCTVRAPPWCECPLYAAVHQGWRWSRVLVAAGAWAETVDGRGRGLVELAAAMGDAEAAMGLVLGAGVRPPETLGAGCADRELAEWLQAEVRSPAPLARLCRHQIRTQLSRASLGRDLRGGAALLPLPPMLVAYLSLDPLGP